MRLGKLGHDMKSSSIKMIMTSGYVSANRSIKVRCTISKISGSANFGQRFVQALWNHLWLTFQVTLSLILRSIFLRCWSIWLSKQPPWAGTPRILGQITWGTKFSLIKIYLDTQICVMCNGLTVFFCAFWSQMVAHVSEMPSVHLCGSRGPGPVIPGTHISGF